MTSTATNTKKKTAPTPLSTKFFINMLNLEVMIQTRDYDYKNIDELIQLYAHAVEYYDYTKDSIKSYFMEKIQIVLASKESLRLIIQKQKKEDSQLNESRRKSKDIEVSNPEVNSASMTSIDTSHTLNTEEQEPENFSSKDAGKMEKIKEEFSDEDEDEDSGKETAKQPEQRTAQLMRMTPRVKSRII